MLEAVCTRRPSVRIAGDDIPAAVVKSRFLKLESSHIEYVFECMDKNTTAIANIRTYVLTALYNAPTTIDSYYRAAVNHDLYNTS